jgi:dethiobiotin synthetase
MDNIFVFGYQNEASGKTTISVSFARALANEGMKTGVFKL